MTILETILTVYANLARHLIRAFLATLGIVLGIAAVVAMMAISEGGKRGVIDQIKAQGIDNIIVRSVKPTTEKRPSPSNTSPYSPEVYGLTQVDYDHIVMTFHNVKQVVPIREIKKNIYDGQTKTDIITLATTANLFDVIRCKTTDRRSKAFRENNNGLLMPTCFIGVEVAHKLFKHQDSLNGTVDVNGTPFTIIGLIESAGQGRIGGLYNINNIVYIPLDMATALWGSRSDRDNPIKAEIVEYSFLYIQVKAVDTLPDTVARLKSYLSVSHTKSDYEFQVPYELMRAAEKTQRIFTIVMTSIAAISLLVGGIGIMNIMLANIFERTREIGIRRALGATKNDILIQFLAESIVLTFIGGALGVGVGILTAHGVEWVARMNGDMNLQVVITPEALIVSLFVAIATGLTFGTYPAWKAAQLDPLVALRHE